ncbi:unnamed protein product [Clonostachys solani]|uniref:Uncharacterized protein n=1 Tax=Clonostachys solani TaxID=160281 RepID=A0A9N9VYY9_9HYPO|nr:unnamed protein product [Clonostachys solani]
MPLPALFLGPSIPTDNHSRTCPLQDRAGPLQPVMVPGGANACFEPGAMFQPRRRPFAARLNGSFVLELDLAGPFGTPRQNRQLDFQCDALTRGDF